MKNAREGETERGRGRETERESMREKQGGRGVLVYTHRERREKVKIIRMSNVTHMDESCHACK